MDSKKNGEIRKGCANSPRVYFVEKKQLLKMLEIADKHNSKPIDLLNNWIDAEYKKTRLDINPTPF